MINIPSHLYDDQRERELESIDRGIARYKETFSERNLSESPPAMRLIRDAMDSLIPQIEASQFAVLEKRVIKGIRKWGGLICSLPADRLALITLISMFNNANTTNRAEYTAHQIGGAVDMERTFDLVRREQPKEYKKAVKYVRQWDSVEGTKFIKRAGYSVPNDRIARLHLGAYLMHLAVEHCGIFKKTLRPDRSKKGTPKSLLTIDLTGEAMVYISQSVEQFSILQPWFQPMIVPPKDWTSLDDGGFDWIPMKLVKSDYRRRSAIHSMSDIGKMHHAVNALQRTPWRINKKILEVVEKVAESGGGIGGMPLTRELELPPMPEGAEQDGEIKSKWLFDRWRVHEKNRNEASKRRSLLTQIMLAKQDKDREAIWFAWQMDWRGRQYPVSTALHPQADDIGKALLEFAEPTPLGEDGFYWLTIHLANCIGWDKDSLEDKVRKVNENAFEISQWVEDPLTHKGWADTDSPYRCLAAANEWVRAFNSDVPEQFESRIPVAMDGTCNGLQHLSALGRDPVGAAATNLIDSEVPSDIYKNVAREVLIRIEQDMQSKVPHIREAATAWKPHVNRKTAKRGTMTTPYGVTKQGMRTQLLTDGLIDEVPGEVNNNLNYMRDNLHNSIGKVVVKGREIMDWLQVCAAKCADKGKACRWKTPLGFVCNQEYLIVKQTWVFTLLQKFATWVPKKDRKMYKARQVRGIAPNYVHSLDACHMAMSIIRMEKEGITNIQAVHDSFGCPAAQVGQMRDIVREEFVKMHSSYLLHKFRNEQTDVDLPDPPPMGSFNLNEVLRSTHFVG